MEYTFPVFSTLKLNFRNLFMMFVLVLLWPLAFWADLPMGLRVAPGGVAASQEYAQALGITLPMPLGPLFPFLKAGAWTVLDLL